MAKVIEHPLIQQKLTIMRQKYTQSRDFRELLEELSMLMAFEVTRDTPTRLINIETPLQSGKFPVLDRKFAIVPILRAGLGMSSGIHKLIPTANIGHIGLYRNEETLDAVEYYCKLPKDIAECIIIVVDPMLATGNSVCAALDLIKRHGGTDIRFMSILATAQGIDQLEKRHPDVTTYTAAIDPVLNDNGYIVPGLGDAGDRIFGTQ